MLGEVAGRGGSCPRFVVVQDALSPGCDGFADSTSILRQQAYETKFTNSPLASLCLENNALVVKCLAIIDNISKVSVVQFGGETAKMIKKNDFIR